MNKISLFFLLILILTNHAFADVIEIPVYKEVNPEEEIDLMKAGSLKEFWDEYYVHSISIFYEIEDERKSYGELFVNNKFFSSEDFKYSPCCFRRFYLNPNFSQIGKSLQNIHLTFYLAPFYVSTINVEVDEKAQK